MQKGTQNYLHATQCINQKSLEYKKIKGKVNVWAREPPLTSACVSLYVGWLTVRAASWSDPSREEDDREHVESRIMEDTLKKAGEGV